ncbi:hypothetical protein [uncultured Parabacteroides sp.]|uniref:hypothetical protein n=1 Tax=uncultured Parabacteroides sp. TaxID=512312 RepID=UPI002594957E|nr:hypothetical protein [uncultured Parabacteroides sp.]
MSHSGASSPSGRAWSERGTFATGASGTGGVGGSGGSGPGPGPGSGSSLQQAPSARTSASSGTADVALKAANRLCFNFIMLY